jgi:predicted NBD/HSP70 family sugar kinase
MNPRQAANLGVDVGGTSIRVAAVAPNGAILCARTCRTAPDGDPDSLADGLRRLCTEVSSSVPLGNEPAGVAIPGIWDRETGVLRRAVNLPRLEGRNLLTLFADALGRPVHLETDVNAAGWAQWRSRVPRASRFVYLSIGTGVGGSVILDGQIVRHTNGGAGHFGFLIVDTDPGAPAGRNEVRGCLSAMVSGPALGLFIDAAERPGERAAEPGPPTYSPRSARALVIGLAQLAHLYNPDVICLGGGVIDNIPGLLHAAREHFELFRSRMMPPHLTIERGPLASDEAGVIGAALLAREV